MKKSTVPVVNAKGEIVARVSTCTTSVGASKVLGAPVQFSRHPSHGYAWVPTPTHLRWS